jgi:hypothetical protein
MRIFEQGEPLDPVEEAEEPELVGGTDVPRVRGYIAPDEARGRSLGIFLLTAADLALGGLALGGALWFHGARGHLLTDSADFGTEMSDALLGLRVLITIGWTLAGGFLLSALGVLSLTRLGYRLQMLWALLLCLTVAGIPYGAAVLVYLRRPVTHSRFFA